MAGRYPSMGGQSDPGAPPPPAVPPQQRELHHGPEFFRDQTACISDHSKRLDDLVRRVCALEDDLVQRVCDLADGLALVAGLLRELEATTRVGRTMAAESASRSRARIRELERDLADLRARTAPHTGDQQAPER